MLSLEGDQIDLWWLRPETITSPGLLERCRQTLDAEERDQQQRFVRPQDRQLYLVAHAALRVALSGYTGVPAEELAFNRNRYGRPELAWPALSPALRFNLSHTRGMVMLGVAWSRELGVDVEDTGRSGQTVELADDFFAASEASALRALPLPQQRSRFFELWTLKEAYIKARGMGLSIPLDHFALAIHPTSIQIHFEAALPDDPRSWQFGLLRPTPIHQAALAARLAPGERPLRMVQRGSPLHQLQCPKMPATEA